jgi:hypothetical protein
VSTDLLKISAGFKVITMDMINWVRRMKLRDQLSLSEIAKRTWTGAQHGQEMAQGTRRGRA